MVRQGHFFLRSSQTREQMADTYDKQQRLQAGVASFVDPGSTTLDVLGSITQMMKIYPDNTSDEYKALAQTARNETAFLSAGAIALQSSPLLQQRLGTGLAACAQVAELLKRRQAETLYNKAIDKTLGIKSIQEKGFGKVAEGLISQSSLITFERGGP